MTDADMPQLTVGTPWTRRAYDGALLLAAHGGFEWEAEAKCRSYGNRRFGYPMIALTVKKNLGSIRHVLSQMVVAGTVEVTPPVEVRVPFYIKEDGTPVALDPEEARRLLGASDDDEDDEEPFYPPSDDDGDEEALYAASDDEEGPYLPPPPEEDEGEGEVSQSTPDADEDGWTFEPPKF